MALLKRDSPLRAIPAGCGEQQILFLEGLRLSIETTDLAYSRLESTLTSIAALPDDTTQWAEDDFTLTALAVSDVWTIVDAVDRARDLLDGLPGLKGPKHSPGRTYFQDQTGAIADLRNKVQHMRSDFYKHPPKAEDRAWGTIRWLYRSAIEPPTYRSYILVPGCSYGAPFLGILSVLPSVPTKPVDRILLECRGVRVNVTNVFRAVRTIAGELEAAVRNAAPGDPQRPYDLKAYLDLRIDPTAPDGPDPKL